MRMKNNALRGWLRAFAALVALCSSDSVAGEAGSGEWQRTLDAARKEGQVVLYGSNE